MRRARAARVTARETQAPTASVARIVLGGGRRTLDRIAMQAARGVELTLGRRALVVLNVRVTKAK